MTRSHTDGDHLTGGSFVEDQRLGPGGAGLLSTKGARGNVLLGRSMGEITGNVAEIGFYIYEIAGSNRNFISPYETQGMTRCLGMIEFLGNHGVATHDDVGALFVAGKGEHPSDSMRGFCKTVIHSYKNYLYINIITSRFQVDIVE